MSAHEPPTEEEMENLTEEEMEEVERRVRSHLEEEGEDPDSDSDHAMYLRQDIAVMVLQERKG